MPLKLSGRITGLLCGAALAGLLPMSASADDTKVITSWDLQTQERTVATIRDAADRFEASHPGFKVEDSHIANDAYKTKLKIAFGANEAPLVFSTSWGGGPLREYIKAGNVTNLTPYLEKNKEFADRFLPSQFLACQV